MTRASRAFVITSMAIVAAVAVMRRRQLRWGATDAESTEPLPGDELVPDPDLMATRARFTARFRSTPTGSFWTSVTPSGWHLSSP